MFMTKIKNLIHSFIYKKQLYRYRDRLRTMSVFTILFNSSHLSREPLTDSVIQGLIQVNSFRGDSEGL